MSSLIGTINQSLTSIRTSPSRAQFFTWTNEGPIINIIGNGNNAEIEISNNILSATTEIINEGITPSGDLITNALTVDQITYGIVNNDSRYTWVMKNSIIPLDFGASTDRILNYNISQTSNINITGAMVLVSYVQIIDGDPVSLRDLRENREYSIAEKIFYAHWNTNRSQLTGITLQASIPPYALNLYTGSVLSVSGAYMTLYANYGETRDLYLNHGFFWISPNTNDAINQITSWSVNPESIGQIQCVPNCPTGYICDNQLGICKSTNDVIPVPPDEGSTTRIAWWVWLLVAVVFIIIVIAILLVIFAGSRTDDDLEILDEDEEEQRITVTEIIEPYL